MCDKLDNKVKQNKAQARTQHWQRLQWISVGNKESQNWNPIGHARFGIDVMQYTGDASKHRVLLHARGLA